MFKKLFAIAAFVGIIFTATCEPEAKTIDYNRLSDNLGIIQEYNTGDLTAEILENRNGDIIIEKAIGKVLNDNGDGKILNTKSKYNYISYRSVKDAKAGDIILTYFLYNPDNNAVDDILYRFDYIIDTKTEADNPLLFFVSDHGKNQFWKTKSEEQKISILKNHSRKIEFWKTVFIIHRFGKLGFLQSVF